MFQKARTQTEPAVVLNSDETFVPRSCAATATTMAMRANKRPYSAIVGACSSLINVLTELINFAIWASLESEFYNSKHYLPSREEPGRIKALF
jgi:hypothetical protein